MEGVTMLRRVSRIGSAHVVFLPARYVGKPLRVLLTAPNGTTVEFLATARRFARAGYVTIPAAVAEHFPPNTVTVVHFVETGGETNGSGRE